MKIRCEWADNNALMQEYHDMEWGIPVHDDQKLFEFLILESFQAGLSWSIILRKRQHFGEAFAGFDAVQVAAFDDNDVGRLMQNEKIVRNRKKIEAAINNARCFLKIREQFGSFDKYIWQFVDFKPVVNRFENMNELPARTELSDAIAKDMKKKGFRFVGSTVMYAHMQATGMVNDHLTSCFMHEKCKT
ncbi:MAG: DNA-3-methyladenine glycosylase I [Prolixibacteraceae bacterium]|nr:DNA-3-methyladenine glycosylase I [Prolixibacteraceae bacterium]